MMHSPATGRIDLRTLTNVERASMGLPLKGNKKGTHRSLGPYQKPREKIIKPEIPAEVRLAEQLREIFMKWAERGIL